MAHTEPFLTRAGGELVFSGRAERYLIGEGEGWDHVLLVRDPSAKAYLDFASDRAHLAGTGHRTAAVIDSCLLPMVEDTLRVSA